LAPKSYIVINGPNPTTAAPTKIATGSATLKTLLQIKSPTTPIIRPVAWGISFDAAAGAAGGTVELIETDVAATVTAYVAADIQKYGDANAPTSSIVIGSTTASGYTASVEGTITVTRYADLQIVQPTAQYNQTWALDREFEMIPGRFLRVRTTFPATVNALCYVVYQEG
jgi:hypothetical protein